MEKAKWLDDSTKESTYKCSNCGCEPLYEPNRISKLAYVTLTPYCAFCGAKMEFEDFDDAE